ncbi:hypothetical protein VTL71DRAFT_9855 [Oculimacula yallundae]|uniref:non-specific serine/threonine protein kinase n=1 Tax=Oculimacula yallundae TaxID=86028 RepID=A0ABR4BQS1_9HELO
MTTGGPGEAFRVAFEFWDNYNAPQPQIPPLSIAGAKARYNTTYANGPPIAPPTTTIVNPLQPVGPPVRDSRLAPPFIPKRAPRTRIDQLPYTRQAYGPVGVPGPGGPGGGPRGSARNWRPVKILGQGANAPPVLWEYNGPLPAPAITRVAVKSVGNPVTSADMAAEGLHMRRLTMAPTEHIVQLIVNPAVALTPAECRAERLDPAIWNGVVRRLVMEYCPQGSLKRLLTYRIGRRLPFEELTLWRIFECLVDGLAVLEYDGELVVTPAAGAGPAAPPVITPPAVFNPAIPMVVHFDLKPLNIFGGNRSLPGGTHPFTPVWKVGDFGLSGRLRRLNHNVPGVPGPGWTGNVTFSAMHRNMRETGSRKYYPPEQFSPRWNYRDYATSTVCGKYGPWTNIWQMGAIMYELACLDRGTPEVCYPFNPASPLLAAPFTIRGVAAQGITYGTRLRVTPYTNALKDAIHECLYEEPANRPTILELKARVLAGIDACRQAGDVPEGWQDLDMPEPKTPLEAKRNPASKRPCCRTLGLNTLPVCGEMVLVDPENQRVRCHAHYNLNLFPFG